jgi:outer membrane protein assembly factor BamB
MIKQKFPKFILALFLITSNVIAQWQIKLDRNLNWFQILPTGNILLANNEGISALDENTGTTLFSLNNITSLNEEEFQIIPNTPFGMITRGQGKLEIKFIFNIITGKVLFDSKKENIMVGKQYIIRNSGDFLMQGLKGSESVFFLVDAETGTIRWELKDFLGKSIFAEVIDGTPLKNEDGNIIFPTTGGMTGGAIYCLSSSNGKLLWKSELPKLKGAQSATITDSKLAVSFLEKDKFIFMKGQAIMAYQIASGKQLWNEPAKQRGLPDLAIYDPFGLIISSAIDQKNTLFKPTMAMYDYNSGKELWNEQVKLKGTVNKYNYCAKGLIISMDNGKGSCFINIVDLGTGTFVFNDHYKVNGIVNEMQLCGTSLYIRTDLEEDFVSLESNKSILEKNISTKQDKPLLNLQQDNFSYTYNPSTDLLSVSDLGLTTQKVLCPDKISFSGNETPTRVEKLGDVIVLSSSQTVAGYDKSGKEIFKTYIPAPGIPGWKKAIHAADAILQMGEAMRYAEAEAKLKEAGKNSNSPEGRALADGFAQIANKGTNAYLAAANKNMDRINKRFKASASGNEVQFILGKLESKDYGLIGISKLNGQKKSEINLGKDKEPKYLLDDISKTIYYLKDGVLKSIKY